MARNLSVAVDILARDKASKNLDKVGNAAQRTGKKFSGLQKIAAGGLLGGAVVKLFKDSVGAASDLNESLSKSRVVFGTFSKDFEKFADTSAESLGISRQATLEAGSTFGNLFRAMDIGQKPAEDMSKKLLALASDLGSFNNVKDPQEVLLALRSGLVGEVEPLRKFGVNLNQARLEAEAFSLGLVKPVKDKAKIVAARVAVEKATANLTKAQKKHGTGSLEARDASAKVGLATTRLTKALAGQNTKLTAAQKAQAAYSVILKDTKLAQGDFARTSDGLAGSQKKMAASFEDAKAKLGEKLLPVMLKATRFITTDVIPGFVNLVGFIDDNSEFIKAVGGISLAFVAIKKAQQGVLAFQSIFRTKMVAEAVLTRSAVAGASAGTGAGGVAAGGRAGTATLLVGTVVADSLAVKGAITAFQGMRDAQRDAGTAQQRADYAGRIFDAASASKARGESKVSRQSQIQGIRGALNSGDFGQADRLLNQWNLRLGQAIVPPLKVQSKAALDTKAELKHMTRLASAQNADTRRIADGVLALLNKPTSAEITQNFYTQSPLSADALMRQAVYRFGRNGKAFA